MTRLALLVLLAPSAALAQPTDLGGGWSELALVSPYDQPTTAACTATHAYFRTFAAGFVSRFDGTTVENLPRTDPSSGSLSGPGLDVAPSGEVLLVGWGHVAVFASGAWTVRSLPERWGPGRSMPLLLDGTRAIVPDDGALLGVTLPAATVTAYSAGTWRRMQAVDGTASEFWAVGQGGIAMHWAHGRLVETRVPSPTATLDDVAVVGPSDVWAWASGRHADTALGSGGAYHWDGSEWTDRSPPERRVQAVVAHGASALASTDDGHVLRWNGSGWDEELTTGRSLRDGCATDTHAVFLDEGGALVFRRWP